MKYFIDTEFIEGSQTKRLLSIPIGKTKPTIDLISIGIVCEDGRYYYAISKDFNLKEAWNRIQLKEIDPIHKKDTNEQRYAKEYWIRENVLKPIWEELRNKQNAKRIDFDGNSRDNYFSYNSLKYLIKKYGKTNKQIAKEVKHFVANRPIENNKEQWILDYDTKDVQCYGYYADYDWVVFCWLFGRMIDLPKGFPKYCIDLKQILDECAVKYIENNPFKDQYKTASLNTLVDIFKSHKDYPKQTDEHHALVDAKWNYKLYNFLNTI